MHRLSILPALAVLAACATVSSGIVPAGAPGQFTITERDSPVNGGAAAATRTAMAKAAAFCRDRHAAFIPGEAVTLGRPVQTDLVGATGFRLTFRCGEPDAPDGPDADTAPPP